MTKKKTYKELKERIRELERQLKCNVQIEKQQKPL